LKTITITDEKFRLKKDHQYYFGRAYNKSWFTVDYKGHTLVLPRRFILPASLEFNEGNLNMKAAFGLTPEDFKQIGDGAVIQELQHVFNTQTSDPEAYANQFEGVVGSLGDLHYCTITHNQTYSSWSHGYLCVRDFAPMPFHTMRVELCMILNSMSDGNGFVIYIQHPIYPSSWHVLFRVSRSGSTYTLWGMGDMSFDISAYVGQLLTIKFWNEISDPNKMYICKHNMQVLDATNTEIFCDDSIYSGYATFVLAPWRIFYIRPLDSVAGRTASITIFYLNFMSEQIKQLDPHIVLADEDTRRNDRLHPVRREFLFPSFKNLVPTIGGDRQHNVKLVQEKRSLRSVHGYINWEDDGRPVF
jgi:hypothetical protein